MQLKRKPNFLVRVEERPDQIHYTIDYFYFLYALRIVTRPDMYSPTSLSNLYIKHFPCIVTENAVLKDLYLFKKKPHDCFLQAMVNYERFDCTMICLSL